MHGLIGLVYSMSLLTGRHSCARFEGPIMAYTGRPFLASNPKEEPRVSAAVLKASRDPSHVRIASVDICNDFALVLSAPRGEFDLERLGHQMVTSILQNRRGRWRLLQSKRTELTRPNPRQFRSWGASETTTQAMDALIIYDARPMHFQRVSPEPESTASACVACCALTYSDVGALKGLSDFGSLRNSTCCEGGKGDLM